MIASDAIRIDGSTLRLAGRPIWQDLTLSVPEGEFLAVIGPNGAGKTSLLKVLLGLLPAGGVVEVLGQPPRRGNRRIGYVPQQKAIDPDLPVRGRDLVRMGLDGDRWRFGGSPEAGRRVDEMLAAVGASAFADASIGRLSGGEQQRLRIAQALVGEPRLLLLDEPLLSLDLHHQREICELISSWQERSGGTVVFVTHDVNPVLSMTDRVLAVVGGRWAAGRPGEILTSATMSDLYGAPVDVVQVRGRVVVLADTGDPIGGHHELPIEPAHSHTDESRP
ncbi:MAG TPA: ATP-binding cassette domain-containing protein [Candidatus Dormibacteraeota bacterium]